jgi:hypothetical protein
MINYIIAKYKMRVSVHGGGRMMHKLVLVAVFEDMEIDEIIPAVCAEFAGKGGYRAVNRFRE